MTAATASAHARSNEVRITIVAGASESHDIRVTDAAGAPVNLDGWMLEASLTRVTDGARAIVKSTVNGGIELLNQVAAETRGIARIHILPLDSGPLVRTSRAYAWQLWAWDVSGAAKLIQGGVAKIT